MSLEVTGSKKDSGDDIIGLCGVGWNHSKSEAVANIGHDKWAYFVSQGGRTVYVRTAVRNGKPYLTTNPDSFKPNNLDDLRDCW
jgi:hypothetical protein